MNPTCIECGSKAEPVGGKAIYPHRPDLYAKRFWLCQCGAYCGSHVKSGEPLGTPAGPETRAARNAAHCAFDPLWKEDSFSRKEAYQWLASQLGIDPKDCHIGMFDAATCRRVVDIARS